MHRDFYYEIRYNLRIFCYLIRKAKLRSGDIERLISLLDDMKELLETYLYDYLN